MIQKHTLVVGPFQCNCTILTCPDTREAVVIDPGDELDRIEAWLAGAKVKLKYALHTHAHLDHVGAVKGLKEMRPEMKISLHKADEWLYQNLPMQGKLFGFDYDTPPPVDHFLEDGEEIRFGKCACTVIHTPGHSPGGVCLRFSAGALGQAPVLFSGDTLFRDSIGRTDLWGADHKLLLKSIRQRLFTLDEETIVHPGHGLSTTVGIEARENPFFR